MKARFRPNVVFSVGDDVRWGDIGWYAQGEIRNEIDNSPDCANITS